MERVTGIEPASEAWKASVLPLNHTRMHAAFRRGRYFTAKGALRKQKSRIHPIELSFQCAQRVSAMRNGILVFAGHLGKRPTAQLIRIKQRIVSKAMFATRLMPNSSLNGSARDNLFPIFLKKH